jgi:hypothetical protein
MRKFNRLAIAALIVTLASTACTRTPTNVDTAPGSARRTSTTPTPTDSAKGPGTFGSGHRISDASSDTTTSVAGGGTFGSGH